MSECSEVSEDCSEEIKEYFELIRKLKMDGSRVSEISADSISSSYSIDQIIENMEEINTFLAAVNGTKTHTIREHLEYTLSKARTFEDAKYEHIFKHVPVSQGLHNEIRKKVASKKALDYSFRDKLTGFLSRSGNLSWDDEKISDFISAIARANNTS